jgi:quinol-cytochrome oxidoreductase complex cytochrome b subunit
MESAGKILLIGAVVLALVGLVFVALSRLGVTSLPGTVEWRSKDGNVSFYFPIGLMIVLSIVGTIVLNVFFRR